MFKLLFRTVVFGAAIGLPMLFCSAPDLWNRVKKTAAELMPSGAASSEPDPAANVPAAPAKPRIPQMQTINFDEVFRFDVTTGWVLSRWARVSTGMSQLQLQGYRVPLVTGTSRDDLAGALTYYFGPEQRVRKITFNGTTGDATRLVQLVTTRYGLRRRPANDSGLFVYEAPTKKGDVQSVLRIRPTGVVKADEPHQRFHVDLLLAPPEQG
ncbi:MAG TPA: DUF6690 family protein [Thermoguttaceae bacterium]|nr:DUF6690 family protein [Thermoguttaceae bacterium]